MGFGVKREAEGGGTARRSNRVAESVSEDAVHCLTVHLLPLRACVSFLQSGFSRVDALMKRWRSRSKENKQGLTLSTF